MQWLKKRNKIKKILTSSYAHTRLCKTAKTSLIFIRINSVFSPVSFCLRISRNRISPGRAKSGDNDTMENVTREQWKKKKKIAFIAIFRESSEKSVDVTLS